MYKIYYTVKRLRSILSSCHSGHSAHSGHSSIILNIVTDAHTNNIRTYGMLRRQIHRARVKKLNQSSCHSVIWSSGIKYYLLIIPTHPSYKSLKFLTQKSTINYGANCNIKYNTLQYSRTYLLNSRNSFILRKLLFGFSCPADWLPW